MGGELSIEKREKTSSTAAPHVFLCLVVSAVVVAGSFIWQGRLGFNMGDEGFLWYGVRQVQAGEVPIRDFMAYDPGRYYWSAALMSLFGSNSIVAFRLAGAVFQFLGLFVGLLMLPVVRTMLGVMRLALVALVLTAWMFNWYKVYDTSVSLFLIGALALLAERPSRGRFFLAGVTVGVAALFGRNHGVYGLAGILGVAAYIGCMKRSVEGILSDLVYCAIGVVLGYSPILIMVAATPGFAEAYWESIRFVVDKGSTNLARPVPWPWTIPVRGVPPLTAAADLLTGVYYVAILLFGFAAPAWLFRSALLKKPVAPPLVAVSTLALPYAHYAFSRAELFHLSLGIFPFLVGTFLILTKLPRLAQRTTMLLIVSTSAIVVLPENPGWDCLVIERCVAMRIGGDDLKIQPLIAGFVNKLESTAADYAPDGEPFLVTPLWPAAYALLDRKSPMWDSHALFPRPPAFEQKEIERIKAAGPKFVLLLDQAVDDRDDLRFRNSHPLIYRYLQENFDPVEDGRWHPSIFQLLKAR